ncbi:diguanylate cyclase domain-containing protein [Luteimonas vadosa]|uniref:histidine kinase n=1 Tax=Luteimonas vadosa TaxID=1165507 RepID=A0ABP9DW85_9GAMM
MDKSIATLTDANVSDATTAARELSRLHERTDDERAVLARLQGEVAQAAKGLGGMRSAQLIEANERLVLAMVHAQSVADRAAKAFEEALRPSEHDPLTALPNRLLLLDRLAQAIEHARRHKVRLAMLFLDLDNFKQVNDTLGHAAGDRILRIVGQRLVASVRATDTVSRHGGDEFLILLSEIDRPAVAVQVADKATAALAAPCRVGRHLLQLEASIGISFYPDDGEDAQTLIDRADVAMYRAKRSSSGSAVFDARVLDEVGGTPPETVSPLPLPLATAPGLPHDTLLNSQLQEANGRLILAALSAQQLQAAAVRAHGQQQEFLAVIAHELRNPLASIRLANSIQQSDEAPASAKARHIVDQEVERMARMVDDLLDLARVNTGKLRLKSEILDMAELFGDAVDGCRPRFDARRQSLSVQVPDQVMPVYGDATRLMQVLTNLLDNASKYTPEGGEIALGVQVLEDVVVTTVSDNGIGIAVDTLPRVFEQFLQDSQARDFNDSGIGVGLTIVRELVEAHGGTVLATSAGIGCGSRFVVSLPLTSISLPAEKS